MLPAAPPASIRFATFNCSLNRFDQGAPIPTLLANPASAAPKKVAEIIQRNHPDILLLNEFDYNPASPATSPQQFQDNFLSVSQNSQPAISYPYRYTAPVNTGIASGFDLNNDGVIDTTEGDDPYGNDAFGYGRWPGQYGMVIYSKFPLETTAIRTFQKFLWKNMPGAVLPDLASTPSFPADFYTFAELNVFRLSSKSHWDVPVNIDNHLVHLLVHHPTPPVFDGTEDRNGRRNHDEIRLWADYISPEKSGYLTDDNSVSGGLAANQRFVIMGDHNADPFKGDSYGSAILQLLDHPLVNSNYSPCPVNLTPSHAFGTGYFNDAIYDTGDFSADLRVDYVLPSKLGLSVLAGAVDWPVKPTPVADIVGVSDHRLVYFDMALTPVLAEAIQNLAIEKSGNSILLKWKAHAGYAYDVQWSSNLLAPWTTDAALTPSINGTTFDAISTDTNPPPGRKFYRIAIRFQ